MNSRIKPKIIIKIAHIFETLLSIVILIAVFFGMLDTLRIMYSSYIVHFNHPIGYNELNGMFAQILLLVIGVEIAVMLILHKQTALLEVLLYGIARKMLLLPKNKGMSEILLGIIAIAGLFAIKRFILEKPEKEKEDNEEQIEELI